jgi:hypothetical protein
MKQRGRGIRKPTLKPRGTFTVEMIDKKTGAPLKPVKAHRKFKTLCGCVVREKVPITVDDWSQVTPEEKTFIVNAIMSQFQLANEEWKPAVQAAALSKAKDSFRNFRHRLYSKFQKKNRDATLVYPFIKPDNWKEFKKYRRTEEFLTKSKAGSALISKNKHPHNMGVLGYAGSKPIWRKQDEEAVASGGTVPYSDLEGERARDFLRARSKTNEVGELVITHPETQKLHKTMVITIYNLSCFLLN